MQRKIKNVVKNYSPAEVKVREATSNDPWGPSTILMSEVSTLTFDPLACVEIMNIIWKRLNDHGKNWRHVYKSLTLLYFLVRSGSEKVVKQCKQNLIFIQTLKDFQYFENGIDSGMNVREAAKKLHSLLSNDSKITNERSKISKHPEHGEIYPRSLEETETFTSFSNGHNQDITKKYKPLEINDLESHGKSFTTSNSVNNRSNAISYKNEEDIQLQLALQLSKKEHEEEEERRKGDEIKLQMALKESLKITQPNNFSPMASQLLEQNLLDPWSISESSLFSSNKKNEEFVGNNENMGAKPKISFNNQLITSIDYSTDPLTEKAAWEEISEKYNLKTNLTEELKKKQNQSLDGFEVLAHRPQPSHINIIKPNNNPVSSYSNNTNEVTLVDDNRTSFLINQVTPQTSINKSNSTGDLLSSNNNLPLELFSNSKTVESLDLVNFSNPNNIDDDLKSTNNKKVTPEEFLGPNAKLVDFDKLISHPPKNDILNPFSLTTKKTTNINPFTEKQKQEEKYKKIPLNLMQQNNNSSVQSNHQQINQPSQSDALFNFNNSTYNQSDSVNNQSIINSNYIPFQKNPSIASNPNYNPFL